MMTDFAAGDGCQRSCSSSAQQGFLGTILPVIYGMPDIAQSGNDSS
jgi:hypothetical protein